jgi:hypothetical protein
MMAFVATLQNVEIISTIVSDNGTGTIILPQMALQIQYCTLAIPLISRHSYSYRK